MRSEPVAGAAGQRVRERLARAPPRFLQICQRVEVSVLAEDRFAPRTIVVEKIVAAEQRPRAALVADVSSGVHVSRSSGAERKSTADTCVCLLLEDDVDNTRHARRIVARGRVWDDLDFIYDVSRQLGEKIPELCRLHRSRASIDLDDHAAVAAKAHDIVDVDIDRRDVAQHVQRGATLGGRHIADDVNIAVGGKLDVLPLTRYLERLQLDHR